MRLRSLLLLHHDQIKITLLHFFIIFINHDPKKPGGGRECDDIGKELPPLVLFLPEDDNSRWINYTDKFLIYIPTSCNESEERGRLNS